jgi:hypothetical protein
LTFLVAFDGADAFSQRGLRATSYMAMATNRGSASSAPRCRAASPICCIRTRISSWSLDPSERKSAASVARKGPSMA